MNQMKELWRQQGPLSLPMFTRERFNFEVIICTRVSDVTAVVLANIDWWFTFTHLTLSWADLWEKWPIRVAKKAFQSLYILYFKRYSCATKLKLYLRDTVTRWNVQTWSIWMVLIGRHIPLLLPLRFKISEKTRPSILCVTQKKGFYAFIYCIGSAKGLYACIYWKKWIFGRVTPMPHRQQKIELLSLYKV